MQETMELIYTSEGPQLRTDTQIHECFHCPTPPKKWTKQMVCFERVQKAPETLEARTEIPLCPTCLRGMKAGLEQNNIVAMVIFQESPSGQRWLAAVGLEG